MVLNIDHDFSNSNSSSSSSSSDYDDDDRWEMVDNAFGDKDGGLPQNDEINELELEVHDAEDQNHRAVTDNNNNNNEEDEDDEDASIAVESTVSSITRECHATVSDVDYDAVKSSLDDGLASGTTSSNFEENDTVEGEVEDDEDILVVIEQLSNMGFAKEQVEKAIRELRNMGLAASSSEIDADAIIGRVLGEEHATTAAASNNNDDKNKYQPTHPLQLPLECTLDYLHSTMQELKDQHQELRNRAKNYVDNVSQSARDIWSNVVKEKDNSAASGGNNERATPSSHHQTRYGVKSRSSILDTIRRANDEHRLAEKVAAIAAVGSATLLALGHPRACLGVAAVAGASLAVGEGIAQQQQRQQQQWQHHEEEQMHFHQSSSAAAAAMQDCGLGKNDLHLD